MAARRSRTGSLAGLLLAVALVAGACTSDEGSNTPSTTTARSSGGPTTTTSPNGGQGDPTDPNDPGSDVDPVQDGTRIEVLSSQPDRASGPEARVRVTPAKDGDLADLRITLGDTDVTDQLTEADGSLEGVVTGLVEGNNTLTAKATGTDTVTQRIRSWPLAGPMISGPHLPLPACSTEENGLGAPTDANCSAPTKVSWKYLTEAGDLKDLPDAAARPADLATITLERPTADGSTTAPGIVRYERGVINRSIYEIASLDPSPGGDDASQADAAWNQRLVYRYGDGCGTTFGQGSANVDALAPTYLEAGYAVATASFNTGAVQCNDVLSAETTMMVKERFIEAFGEPLDTIGEGTGNGAAQLHLIAQNYPGLVDAIVGLNPFPDIITVANGAADCGLLNAYYRTPAGKALTPEQRTAINGHATAATCDQWEAGYGGLVDPTDGCDPKIPANKIYDAATNPGGLRCTLQDANANQFGRSEANGLAERPLDNVGLQYGLEALRSGTISFDQFIALNTAVGGFDLDGTIVPEREEATQAAVAGAYENGRISSGVGDQLKIPIIDVNTFTDPEGDIHDRFRAFSLRDRLTYGAPAEAAPGFQIWTRDPDNLPADGVGPEAVDVAATWLDAIAEDDEGGSRDEAVGRVRPDAAVDNCLPEGATEPEGKVGIYDEKGPCRDDHPISGDPRIAAGAPIARDIIKCQLKAVDPADYEGVELTDERFAALQEAFPEGVCDWAQAGAGQTTPSMTDRDYGAEDDPNNPALLP